ncbi:AbrB/MazE/SpoVT family DNA-binding domain-containing protein (plasmid) [Alicyclobacillus sp. ALC3]|nr:AbrB/MazE/SpoVT family DNA-binding domain-containing protein [Alicyclobacillus sp. ALC3]
MSVAKVNGGRRMIKAKLGKRSQLVLPKAIVDAMKLEEGTEFEVQIVDGRIVMEPMLSIPRSQAWFWSDEWQKREREADEDARAGRMTTIRNAEELDAYIKGLGVQQD